MGTSIIPIPRPQRPPGVVIAAIVLALIACGFLFFGLMGLAAASFVHSTIQTPEAAQLAQYPALKVMEIASGILILLIGGFCAWTAVDLFRVKRWARISILILGGLVTIFSLIEAAVFCVIAFGAFHAPQYGTQPIKPEVMEAIFLGMAGFCFLFTLIGVWWLIYFNLHRVRVAFASAGAPSPMNMVAGALPATKTHASGTVRILVNCLAVLYLLGAACAVADALLRFPFLLFSHLLRGTSAALIALFFAAVAIWLGIGLLRRIKAAWIVTWVFNGLGLLMQLWLLFPSSRRVMVAYQQGFAIRMGTPGTAEVSMANTLGPIMLVSAIGGTLLALAIFWLLFRAKTLFEQAHTSESGA